MQRSGSLALLTMLLGCMSAHKEQGKNMSDHAVLVYFDYGSTDLAPVFELEDRLLSAIDGANAGDYDGNEMSVDGSDGVLFMYGPDADRLFSVVRPILESAPFMRGARVKLRYGPPEDDAREVEVKLEA